VPQKHIDVSVGTVLPREGLRALRRTDPAVWKTENKPGDGSGQFLARVGLEDFAFRFVFLDAGAREGSS